MDELEILKNKIERLEKMLAEKAKDCTQLISTKINYEKMLGLSQLLLEVYRLNSKFDNIYTNIDLSLTHVAGALLADVAFVIKKDKTETKIIDSSYQYHNSDNERRNTIFKEFIKEFKLEESFPLSFTTLSKIDDSDITVIDIMNTDSLDETCKKYNIKRLSFVPIIIDEKTNYYLGVANASTKANIDLLKYLSPAYSDSIKRILQQKKIQQMAMTDNFTGLYDRGYFNKITEKLEYEQNQIVTYIIVDLFRLKYVNDNHGHETGDKYIQQVANLLKKHFSKDNLVFRIGGDEFGIICLNKSQEYIDFKLTELSEDVSNLNLKDRFGNDVITRIDYGYEIAQGKIDFEEIAYNADVKMNANKEHYYKTHNLERRK